MFYSQKLKILIIGIPKTGSTTVENALIKFEPDGERHTITINDRLFTSDDFHQGILGHARAFEIKDVLGPDIYNSLYTIAFIRHPFSRLVSAYYFNKRNSLFEFLKIKSGKKSLFRKLKNFTTILATKIFPFYVWVFLYPYKSNYEYIFDGQGERLVKYIGRTEHLSSDLKAILSEIGIDTTTLEVGHLNTSNHRNADTYYQNSFFKFLVSKKVNKDLKLYERVSSVWGHE